MTYRLATRRMFSLSRPLPRMLEAPDAEISTAPTEIDGQEVIVHKRVNLFPRAPGGRS